MAGLKREKQVAAALLALVMTKTNGFSMADYLVTIC